MPRYKRLRFQYRVLQRIIGVQDWLFKTKVSDNSDCRLCQEHTESTAHFFSECKFWNDLWENVASWIKSQTKETVIITKNMKILGCLEPCAYFWPLNFILLITRYYIFTRAWLLGDLHIYHLQQKIQNRYLEQECLSKINSTDRGFTKNVPRNLTSKSNTKSLTHRQKFMLFLLLNDSIL